MSLETRITALATAIAGHFNGLKYPGRILQVRHIADATAKTSAVTIPLDDTIPQSGEGTAYSELDLAITPRSADSDLLVVADLAAWASASVTALATLFRNSETNALDTGAMTLGAAGYAGSIHLCHRVAAGSTSAQTFKVRFGRLTGTATVYLNDFSTPYYGGTMKSTMTIYEISGS